MSTGANGFMTIKLNSEIKTYLENFQNVHNKHKEKYQGKQLNFRELVVDLGNEYVTRRVELKEKYTGEELNNKLEKLEIAFSVYNEEKVVGEIKEVGTMANEVHFTLVVAKSDRYIKEAILAVKNGKSAKSAVKRDITNDDKVTVSNILLHAKKIFILLTEYFNESETKIIDNNTEKLNEFIKGKIEKDEWSFSKLMATFELLDITKGAKEDRYTTEKFKNVIESNEIAELFSDSEKNVFIELFRIYN